MKILSNYLLIQQVNKIKFYFEVYFFQLNISDVALLT